MKRSIASVCAALALVLTAALPATAAQIARPRAVPAGVPVACGDVVSTDAYLAADLHCTDGVGLTLLESVTLDLNGHRLVGPGREAGGVAVTYDQGKPVTVTNGTITGWWVGVAASEDSAPSSTPSTLTKLTFTESGTAVRAFQAGYAISWSRFARNDLAVSGFSSLPVSVTRSSFTDGGIEVASTRLSIADSSFLRAPVRCTDGGLDVTRSSFARASGAAISQDDCNGSTVRNSLFTGNGTAYVSSASPSVPDELTGNTFLANTVALQPRAGAVVRASLFLRNTQALVIPADFTGSATYTIESSTFTRNVDAVQIEAVASLQDVRATSNSGWGIYAPNAVDLGGNVAYGNGKDPQCVGVTCSAG